LVEDCYGYAILVNLDERGNTVAGEYLDGIHKAIAYESKRYKIEWEMTKPSDPNDAEKEPSTDTDKDSDETDDAGAEYPDGTDPEDSTVQTGDEQPDGTDSGETTGETGDDQ